MTFSLLVLMAIPGTLLLTALILFFGIRIGGTAEADQRWKIALGTGLLVMLVNLWWVAFLGIVFVNFWILQRDM